MQNPWIEYGHFKSPTPISKEGCTPDQQGCLGTRVGFRWQSSGGSHELIILGEGYHVEQCNSLQWPGDRIYLGVRACSNSDDLNIPESLHSLERLVV